MGSQRTFAHSLIVAPAFGRRCRDLRAVLRSQRSLDRSRTALRRPALVGNHDPATMHHRVVRHSATGRPHDIP
eukprot:361631-Chlamydomonas_euryale.AAC.8